MDIDNNIDKSRSMYYISRELYYFRCWNSAIKLLKCYCKSVDMWQIEKAKSYCILGECYQNIGKINKAIVCYKESSDIYPHSREPLIKLIGIYTALYYQEKDTHIQKKLLTDILNYNIIMSDVPFGVNIYEEVLSHYI